MWRGTCASFIQGPCSTPLQGTPRNLSGCWYRAYLPLVGGILNWRQSDEGKYQGLPNLPCTLPHTLHWGRSTQAGPAGRAPVTRTLTGTSTHSSGHAKGHTCTPHGRGSHKGTCTLILSACAEHYFLSQPPICTSRSFLGFHTSPGPTACYCAFRLSTFSPFPWGASRSRQGNGKNKSGSQQEGVWRVPKARRWGEQMGGAEGKPRSPPDI